MENETGKNKRRGKGKKKANKDNKVRLDLTQKLAAKDIAPWTVAMDALEQAKPPPAVVCVRTAGAGVMADALQLAKLHGRPHACGQEGVQPVFCLDC